MGNMQEVNHEHATRSHDGVHLADDVEVCLGRLQGADRGDQGKGRSNVVLREKCGEDAQVSSDEGEFRVGVQLGFFDAPCAEIDAYRGNAMVRESPGMPAMSTTAIEHGACSGLGGEHPVNHGVHPIVGFGLVPVRVEHRVGRMIKPRFEPPRLRFPHGVLHELNCRALNVRARCMYLAVCSAKN